MSEIVKGINKALREKLTSFPTAKYWGIVYQIAQKEGSRYLYLPADIDLFGQAQLTTFDDINEMGIYHRIVGTSYTQIKKDGYGDDNSTIQHLYDIDLVIMANRKKVKVQPDALEMAVSSNILSSFKIPGIQYINISPISSNINSRSVFSNEFVGLDYFLKPEHILFSIRYRVELRYQKGCTSLCHCEETL
ncbi:hypothetical protein [Chitinophaga nivalis]|uniref:Uncharacterized protein n=1 Tax=Chitinophaga nivalis TaxID=2991709 RepID=A0ABT3IIN8_9BACT|nr:hypothetical protein [Chitinophaga nivalis]MCW3466495.1 hypothetical protein [Chitinophaga nivalis]MCW3483814.1 hypothetical protein [Chitinophaga nivalis]